MDDEAVARTLDRIRGGWTYEDAWDVYGTGRVRVALRWDVARGAFVEERTELDMAGGSFTSESVLDEAAAARLVRQGA